MAGEASGSQFGTGPRSFKARSHFNERVNANQVDGSELDEASRFVFTVRGVVPTGNHGKYSRSKTERD